MPSTEDADRILSSHAPKKACYPCAKRKVKCSAERPCTTCVQRGHPDICIVDSTTNIPPAKRRAVARDTSQIAENQGLNSSATSNSSVTYLPRHAGVMSVTDLGHQGATVDSYLGEDSTPTFLKGCQSPAGKDLDTEVRPALGLNNTLEFYPFASEPGITGPPRSIDDLLPTHAEILKYSQLYQSVYAPFYPLVVDSGELEDIVCFYLQATSTWKTNSTPIFANGVRQSDIAQLGLLLSVLARGSQLADLPPLDRAHVSREFLRRAFHCARLCNFLLKPKPMVIQSLLLIGDVLQNDGQADAAWALMGTSARLAESLSLHKTRRGPSTDLQGSQSQSKPASIWLNLLWQDCILSTTFDRSPVSTLVDQDVSGQGPMNLSYLEYMYEISHWSHALLKSSSSSRSSMIIIRQHLKTLDCISKRCAPHIRSRDACNTRQTRIEHHLCRLATARCLFNLYRPVLRHALREKLMGDDLQRVKFALVEAMEAFLDLQSLSILPLRTWSLIHGALSSAMVLEYSGLARGHQHGQNIQSNFIALLKDQCNVPGNESSSNSLWLSTAHARAIIALQSAVAKRQAQEQEFQVLEDAPVLQQNDNVRPGEEVQSSLDDLQLLPPPDELAFPNLAFEPLPDFPLDQFGQLDWNSEFYNPALFTDDENAIVSWNSF